MTPAERARLQRASHPSLPARGLAGVGSCVTSFLCLVGCSVFGILLMCFPLAALTRFHLPGSVGVALLLVGMGGGFWVGLRYLRGEARKVRRRRAPTEQALAANRVDVLHCTITDALELVGPRRASVYLLNLGNGLVMCLKEGTLSDLDADEIVLNEEGEPMPCFPCRTFDVVRLPESKLILAVQNLGPPLRPSQTLNATAVGLDEIDLLKDGEILTISFQNALNELPPLLASREDE
jgi:hypothetical protein